MNIGYLLFVGALAACGYSLYQSTFAQLEVPSLNESAANTEANKPDMIATKMKFGDKREGVLDMLIYTLKDQNFVVGNNSQMCPEQNCEFEFKDTDLVYQPGSNDITLDGIIKI